MSPRALLISLPAMALAAWSATPAHAADVHIGIGFGITPPPVYYEPTPAPEYAPPPVYYGPDVVYGDPDWAYGGPRWRGPEYDRWRHEHRRPEGREHHDRDHH